MKKILIFTENFFPAYKAGGPVQSITNLLIRLQDDYDFSVVTSAYDLQSSKPLANILLNKWNSIYLPGSKKPVSVWYSEKSLAYCRNIKKLFTNEADCIYINGIFSVTFFLIPLTAIRMYKVKAKIIVCPRGMLQKGALNNKVAKKQTYLTLVKSLGLIKNVSWHATNAEEKNDIIKQFPKSKGTIDIAANIPKLPGEEIYFLNKSPHSLNLIYLSLITEKKNLLFLLQLLNAAENIKLDIYGPVKDIAYWEECKKLIDSMPGKVRYLGDVAPMNVQNTFSKYHASVLLTRGENFGHALYESLSIGRPIITSNFTPWNNLQDQKAGWNLNISSFAECLKTLNDICNLDSGEFFKYYEGAYQIAKDYFEESNDIEGYKHLFSLN